MDSKIIKQDHEIMSYAGSQSPASIDLLNLFKQGFDLKQKLENEEKAKEDIVKAVVKLCRSKDWQNEWRRIAKVHFGITIRRLVLDTTKVSGSYAIMPNYDKVRTSSDNSNDRPANLNDPDIKKRIAKMQKELLSVVNKVPNDAHGTFLQCDIFMSVLTSYFSEYFIKKAMVITPEELTGTYLHEFGHVIGKLHRMNCVNEIIGPKLSTPPIDIRSVDDAKRIAAIAKKNLKYAKKNKTLSDDVAKFGEKAIKNIEYVIEKDRQVFGTVSLKILSFILFIIDKLIYEDLYTTIIFTDMFDVANNIKGFKQLLNDKPKNSDLIQTTNAIKTDEQYADAFEVNHGYGGYNIAFLGKIYHNLGQVTKQPRHYADSIGSISGVVFARSQYSIHATWNMYKLTDCHDVASQRIDSVLNTMLKTLRDVKDLPSEFRDDMLNQLDSLYKNEKQMRKISENTLVGNVILFNIVKSVLDIKKLVKLFSSTYSASAAYKKSLEDALAINNTKLVYENERLKRVIRNA
jgi:hypothetical protein